MSKTFTISEGKYLSLLEAETKLTALEQTGVDNWDGYGEAMKIYKQMLKKLNLEE